MPNVRPSVASAKTRQIARRGLAIAFAVLLAFAVVPRHAGAAVTIGGPFELVAPNGQIVTDQTFRGKWLLVYFGYTSCPDSCPTTLTEIARALGRLGPTADEVQPLFITLDPRHDTREIMGAYTRSFDPRILGLTGTLRQIADVVKAYGVYVQQHDLGSDTPSPLLDHSTYVYVMGPDGRFQRALEHEPTADDIVAALRVAMSHVASHDSRGVPAAAAR